GGTLLATGTDVPSQDRSRTKLIRDRLSRDDP
ncbi:MAG: hypothetical protein ACI8Y8_003942, partial [Planctomycetota bacterium]